MNKTKRKIAILALTAIFVFSWSAMYSPVLADGGGTPTTSNPPGDPGDGDGGKSSAGKGTKPQTPPPASEGVKSWLEMLAGLVWDF